MTPIFKLTWGDGTGHPFLNMITNLFLSYVSSHFFCKIKSPNTLSLNKLKFIRPYNNKYTNNISILKLWAEMVMGRNGMGRNGHWPIWLWAEMTNDRGKGIH